MIEAESTPIKCVQGRMEFAVSSVSFIIRESRVSSRCKESHAYIQDKYCNEPY